MNQQSFFLTEGNCESAYAVLRDRGEVAHHRQFIEGLWNSYAPFADAHFLSDARNHLQERFWEMYLGCTLLQNGYNLYNPSAKGPEFYCQVEGVRCWFEAITPGPGDGPDSVPEMEFNAPVATRVPEDEIILRLRHAIHEKHRKLHDYLSDNTIREDDAYILAINSKRIRSIISDSIPPMIAKAVFPIGTLVVSIDTSTKKQVDEFHLHRDRIVKQSGNEVTTDVFMDARYASISAVLYSSVDVANYPSVMGADFLLLHNPLAKIPLRRSILPCAFEYWVDDSQLKWINGITNDSKGTG